MSQTCFWKCPLTGGPDLNQFLLCRSSWTCFLQITASKSSLRIQDDFPQHFANWGKLHLEALLRQARSFDMAHQADTAHQDSDYYIRSHRSQKMWETEWANGFNAGRPRRLLCGVHVNTWPRRVRGSWLGRHHGRKFQNRRSCNLRNAWNAMLSRGREGNLNEVILYEIDIIRISKFISTKAPNNSMTAWNSWNFFFFQAEVVAYLRWVLCSVKGPGGVGFGWLRCHAGNFLDFQGSICESSTLSND